MTIASYGRFRGNHVSPQQPSRLTGQQEPVLVRIVSFGLNPVHTAGPANAYIVRLQRAGSGECVIPMSREQMKAYERVLLVGQVIGGWYRIEGTGGREATQLRCDDTMLTRLVRAITQRQVVLDDAPEQGSRAIPSGDAN